MALPGDVTTTTITFGPYTDAEGAVALVGAKGKLFPVDPATGKRLNLVHVATGQEIIPSHLVITVGSDGTDSVGPIPHTDNAGLSTVGFAYRVEWDIASNKPSPGSKTFAVPTTSGATVDFDLLDVAAAVPGVLVAVAVHSVNGATGTVVLDADDIPDGAAHVSMTATERTKLAAVATGATANAPDVQLRDRSTHTGEQATSTVTGLDTALAAKAPLASPAFTGTPTGITKTHVGLGNVDNTADSAKPVSTAQQAALDALAARTFTVVIHNAVAATPRPAGAPAVYWIGTVEPTALEDQDFWWNPSAPAESYEPLNGTSTRLLTAGESTVERLLATAANPSTSQGLRLTYLTAQRSEAVVSLRIITAGTAAAATPTLCRLGVYEENLDGSLTLVASTANDTTLFAAAQTIYTVPLTASWNKVRGKRYAIGRLIVSAAAMPSFRGVLDPGGLVNEWAQAPRLTGQWTGQTSLPSTVPAVSVSNSSQFDYVALIPA